MRLGLVLGNVATSAVDTYKKVTDLRRQREQDDRRRRAQEEIDRNNTAAGEVVGTANGGRSWSPEELAEGLQINWDGVGSDDLAGYENRVRAPVTRTAIGPQVSAQSQTETLPAQGPYTPEKDVQLQPALRAPGRMTANLPRGVAVPNTAAPASAPAARPNINLRPQDLDLGALTLLGEAGDEQGRRAVASVIANRLKASPGATLADIVLAPSQFEPWSTRRDELLRTDRNSPAYANALQWMREALDGQDPTNGATHFYSPTAQAALIAQGSNRQATPDWAAGRTGTNIGGNVFFNLPYTLPATARGAALPQGVTAPTGAAPPAAGVAPPQAAEPQVVATFGERGMIEGPERPAPLPENPANLRAYKDDLGRVRFTDTPRTRDDQDIMRANAMAMIRSGDPEYMAQGSAMMQAYFANQLASVQVDNAKMQQQREKYAEAVMAANRLMQTDPEKGTAALVSAFNQFAPTQTRAYIAVRNDGTAQMMNVDGDLGITIPGQVFGNPQAGVSWQQDLTANAMALTSPDRFSAFLTQNIQIREQATRAMLAQSQVNVNNATVNQTNAQTQQVQGDLAAGGPQARVGATNAQANAANANADQSRAQTALVETQNSAARIILQAQQTIASPTASFADKRQAQETITNLSGLQELRPATDPAGNPIFLNSRNPADSWLFSRAAGRPVPPGTPITLLDSAENMALFQAGKLDYRADPNSPTGQWFFFVRGDPRPYTSLPAAKAAIARGNQQPSGIAFPALGTVLGAPTAPQERSTPAAGMPSGAFGLGTGQDMNTYLENNRR